MKKMIILIATAFMTLCLAACGSNGTQPSSSTNSSQGLSDASTLESAEYTPNSDNTPEKFSVEEENTTPESSSTKGYTESTDKKSSTIAKPYDVGDIILANGSVIDVADLAIVDDSNFPIAVIAGLKDDGTALGVGVHRSSSPLQWAADVAPGYTTKFLDIVSMQDGATFTGDTDGTDNWVVISVDDSQGAVDAEKNYPAFSFVNTYAETYNLQGDYASGWYMPSIAELCTIYENREVINTSLQKIFELNKDAAMNGLETNWYWSSSQADAEDDYAWFVHFVNGYAGECPKNFTNVHALAVRTF